MINFALCSANKGHLKMDFSKKNPKTAKPPATPALSRPGAFGEEGGIGHGLLISRIISVVEG